MHIKFGFILKEAAGEYIAVPYGGEYEECGAILTLNSTGAFLWKLMQEECEQSGLSAALVEEYGIDKALADEAAAVFIKELKEENLLEGAEG